MPTKKARAQAQLRRDAEMSLTAGSAPPYTGAPGVDALTLLHGLAGNPVRASDALRVLHELQVHQVELDLQREQTDHDYRELNTTLDRYAGMFDFAPVAYFAVAADGRIIEANHAGAGLFDVARNELAGHMIDSFVAAASRPALAGLLQRLHQSTAIERCTVLSMRRGGTRVMQVVANVAPGGASVLLACVDITDRVAPD